jgi:HK97 family phage major capsid protein
MDTKTLREKRDNHLSSMRAIMEKPSLSAEDRTAFDQHEQAISQIDTVLKSNDPDVRTIAGRSDKVGNLPSHLIMAGQGLSAEHATKVPEVRGEPGEKLVAGQSAAEYVRRAAANGVTTVRREGDAPTRMVARDRDYLNDYWAVRMGLKTETRGLSEDTSGSALAVVPQAWTGDVIDYLYANSVAGALGVSRVMLPTEIYNAPVLSEPAQPAWLAENSAIGLDSNPAFGTIQYNAQGGWKDIVTFSVELAQDAYVNGGLADLLAQSVARNMALAVDAAMINGVVGNAGNPGLNGETNFVFRHYTGDSGTSGIAPVDTTEPSIINENIRQLNSRVSAFLCNNTVVGTLARLNSSAYAKYWDMPQDVADIPWVTTSNSNVVPTTETDPSTASSVALTGGSYSSIYAGYWPFVGLGVHLDLQSRPLTERYADLGLIGLFNFARYSIRTAHPETFSRTIGLITT